ncbi:S41 family peptidase [Chryseobacterium daecheongense]|nr:S41 family peptidase [Chryseobacterium daecheongense]
MIKKIFVFSLLSFFTSLFSQYSISEINKDAYLKDFDIATAILLNQHPNPYRFRSKEAIAKKLDSLRKVIEKDPSYINFNINNPGRVLGDGHISFIPDSNYHEDYLNSTYFFPLITYVNNGNVYVNADNKYNIEVGSKLLEINNRSVADILKQIPEQADGNIKVEDLDISMYVSFINENKDHTFTIKYQALNGEQKKASLEGITFTRFNYESRHAVLPIDVSSEIYGIFGYEISPDTFYLSVRSFSYDESFFYEKLKKYFQKIKNKKYKNLVVDIRNNSGGSVTNIPLLYSFMSKEKIFTNSYKYGSKVIDINYSDYLIDPQTDRYYSEKDIRDSNNFMRQRFDKSEKGDYYFGNNRLDDTYIKNYPRDGLFFDGKVVLLINNRTFSAATYFASLFKKEKRGEIVGKETGSCSNFTTAAWFLTYKLPNTKMTISIPRTEIFFNNNENDNIPNCTGVIPDYKIDNNFFLKLLKERKDPELQYSLQLLSRKS